jgi:hypothetical protein
MEAPMSDAMTAKEISEAWLTFVNDTFMVENGCGRPDADEAFKRLEEGNQLVLMRERNRFATDLFITETLNNTPEKRIEMFTITDAMSLALIQDRIQSGTQLLIGFVQQDVKINIEGEQALDEFFRQILYQIPV